MRVSLYQLVKANSVILVNAGSLVGTTAVSSVLGFAYWWFAARQFSSEAVGLASAAISAMTLLGTFSMLGLGTLLMGELPRQRGKEASLICAALIVVGGVGGCLGIVFAANATYLSNDFQVLRAGIGNLALFAVSVSLAAISLVLDEAVIGLFRSELQLWRNVLLAVSKLAALFAVSLWLSKRTGLTIFATWTFGNALSLAALAGFGMWKGRWSGRTYLPHWGLLRKLGPAALQHQALNLLLLAPGQLLPVLVTVMLSARANAWFYVSLMFAQCVFIVPIALTWVLFASGSAEPTMIVPKMRLTLSLSLVLSALANGVYLLGAKEILHLFGRDYADHAVWSLCILGLVAFPLTIRNHYLAICRIHNRLAQAMPPMLVGGVLELSGAALGAYLGNLTGLCLGWFTAICFEAMFTFPVVYKTLRSANTSSVANQP